MIGRCEVLAEDVVSMKRWGYLSVSESASHGSVSPKLHGALQHLILISLYGAVVSCGTYGRSRSHSGKSFQVIQDGPVSTQLPYSILAFSLGGVQAPRTMFASSFLIRRLLLQVQRTIIQVISQTLHCTEIGSTYDPDYSNLMEDAK